jgi:membrane protein DedA with SNARE-associated domain
MTEIAFDWITRHGYAGIFSLLVFGIVGLPVPDEWLLTFSGYLVFRHTLHFIPTLLAAFLGSACGITISYALGRLFDTYVIIKYGSVLHITPQRMSRVHRWFERRGRWTLLIGYFIPGVRHLTGYVAGASELPLASFMLFAYTGAFCWATTFTMLGYFLGEEWSRVLGTLHQTKLWVIAAGIAVVVGYGAFTYWNRYKPSRESHGHHPS